MNIIRRYVRLFVLSIRHYLGLFFLVLLLAITFLLPTKKKKPLNNKIAVLSGVSITYDGRIQKSLSKLQEYFSTVFLVKPKDALEDDVILSALDTKNLKTVLTGYAGSYSHMPYCFDLSIFFYILRSQCSHIYCHDTPTCLMGFLASKLTGKIFIADLHEWMSETIHISKNGTVSHLPFYKKVVFEIIERIVLHNADYVITVSETLSQLIQKKYNIDRPIIIIKNTGSILKNFQPEKIQKTKPEIGSINLLYFGQIHAHRNIENLIYGLFYCHGFNLWIQGTCSEEYKRKLLKIIISLDLQHRIQFLSPVAPIHVINEIKKADIGIMSCKTFSKNLKNSLPNKVFEYIDAEIPFICEDLPAVKQLIGFPSFVKYFNSDTPESFRDVINSIDNNFLECSIDIKQIKQKLFHHDDFDQYATLRKE